MPCSKRSSGWNHLSLGLLVLLFGAMVAIQPALAGPPTEDLPDVKMPAVNKDHPRLVFRPEGKVAWTFERVKRLYETGAEPPAPASRPASQPASQPAGEVAAATQAAGSQAAASRPGPGRGRRGGGRGGQAEAPTVPPTYEQATSLRAILKPWLDRPVDKDSSPAASALRYRLMGDEAAAERAIGQMQNRPMEDIGAEYYSNGWEYALAYDWLFDHPSITPEKRAKIEGYLVANAKRALELLNDDGWELSPSMWHGRTKIANLAMIVALSLETAPEAEELRAQISRFFGDGCRALRLSEGWPEGYAYWLGNRSFPFALAVDCWRTATGEPSVAGIDLAEMIRRTDLWHVYGQGPDDRFLIYGDVFQGVRMDYFWRAQTMDYYARITGDPYLQAFAVYGHLKSPRPYYDSYRWAAALAFDPEGKMPKGSTQQDVLAGLKDLPLSDLFGAGAYNLAVFRTGWKPDDTQVSFKAGDVQVHHAHYDAGTFTIYKEAPLAVLSGTYAGFGSEHRQMYYVQSVAANCPLVLMPGEQLETTRYYEGPFTSSGGQRVVLPGGSDVQSAAMWRRESQPGHAYAAGRMTGYNWQAGAFGFAAADLTCAYNSTLFSWPGQKPKIRRAARALVYLPEPETVLVYDRIVATSADYQKKWLLHTMNKPEVGETKVLKGEAGNGILEATGKNLVVTNKKGVMNVQALLPEKSRWLLIGGEDYRFYIEADGDQADGFDGVNPVKGLNDRGSYFDNGNWRAELEPTMPAESDDFLVAMPLGTTDAQPRHRAVLVGRGEHYAACQVGATIVVFVDRVDGPEVRDVKVTPVVPVSKAVVCQLTSPQTVPVDRFETVQPERASAERLFPVPLPAGQPATLAIP
jgi:hypothetical protein